MVDFYADWCGPCKRLAPIIEEVALEKAKEALVVKVDVDAAEDIAARYRISSIPTLMVFQKGEVKAMGRGMMLKPAIEALIEQAKG